MKWAVAVGVTLVIVCGASPGQTNSALLARGYTVLPEPQRVALDPGDLSFDQGWHVHADASIPANDVAIETLHEELRNRFHISLSDSAGPGGLLSLKVAPGLVKVSSRARATNATAAQEAYRIRLHPGAIQVEANTSAGLLYGVETLIQLVQPRRGQLRLPTGVIEDWPNLSLRHIYWDDSHHLERLDELKRILRQAAAFKINGIALKLNGHFQYRSAPALVEPYAFSPAELQEATTYGLRYNVSLIPYLDGPGHVDFILKHPEYQDLRAFPDNDYELCSTNPKSYELLHGMYRDLLAANKGVKLFYLSTDEAYYAGMPNNAQCNESTLAEEKASASQIFVHYVQDGGTYLHDNGRDVIFWGEYPLRPEDIGSLPPFLVNGEVYGRRYDLAFRERGIRQMIYTATEGEEMLFPRYYPLAEGQLLHHQRSEAAPLRSISDKISFDSARQNATIIGEVNAGWADEGVHPETFWLGYATSAAAAWHPGVFHQRELATTFFHVFYGGETGNLGLVYRMMSQQAQTWADSWDWTESTARQGIWGSSYSIYKSRKPARDQTLRLPPAPGPDLSYRSNWASENRRRIQLASQAAQQSQLLIGLLTDAIPRVQVNRYNLEIYLSIAQFYQQNATMITDLAKIDADLLAADATRDTNPEQALRRVDHALLLAQGIWLTRNEALQDATRTWERAWFPRVQEANGRHFLLRYDDVKDHLPDRTVDLSYLVYREKRLRFGDWIDSVVQARNAFAGLHQLPVRQYNIAWDDLTEITASGRARPVTNEP